MANSKNGARKSALHGIESHTKVIAEYASLQIALFRVGLVVGLIFALFALLVVSGNWGGNSNNISNVETPKASPTPSDTYDFSKDQNFKDKYLK